MSESTRKLSPRSYQTPAGGRLTAYGVVYDFNDNTNYDENNNDKSKTVAPQTTTLRFRLDTTKNGTQVHDRLTEALEGTMAAGFDQRNSTLMMSNTRPYDASQTPRMSLNKENRTKSIKVWIYASMARPIEIATWILIIFLLGSYLSGAGFLIHRFSFAIFAYFLFVLHLMMWIALASPINLIISRLVTDTDQYLGGHAQGSKFQQLMRRVVKSNMMLEKTISIGLWLNKTSVWNGQLWFKLLLFILLWWTHVLIILSIMVAVFVIQPSPAIILSTYVFTIIEGIVLLTGGATNYDITKTKQTIWNLMDPLSHPIWNPVEWICRNPFRVNVDAFEDDSKTILLMSKWNDPYAGWFHPVPWLAALAPEKCIRSRATYFGLPLHLNWVIVIINTVIRGCFLGVISSWAIYQSIMLKIIISSVTLLTLWPIATLSILLGHPWILDSNPYLPITLEGSSLGVSSLLYWTSSAIVIAALNRLFLREYRHLVVLSKKGFGDINYIIDAMQPSSSLINKLCALTELSYNIGVDIRDSCVSNQEPFIKDSMTVTIFCGYLCGTKDTTISVPRNTDTTTTTTTTDSTSYDDDTTGIIPIPKVIISSLASTHSHTYKNKASMIIASPDSHLIVGIEQKDINIRDKLMNLWSKGSVYAPIRKKPKLCPQFLLPSLKNIWYIDEVIRMYSRVICAIPFEILSRMLFLFDEKIWQSIPTQSTLKSFKEGLSIAFAYSAARSIFICAASYTNGFSVKEVINGSSLGLIMKDDSIDDKDINTITPLIGMSTAGAISEPALYNINGYSMINKYIPQLLLSPYRLSQEMMTAEQQRASEGWKLKDVGHLALGELQPLDLYWGTIKNYLNETILIVKLLDYFTFTENRIHIMSDKNSAKHVSLMPNGPRELKDGELIKLLPDDIVLDLRQISTNHSLNFNGTIFKEILSGTSRINKILIKSWAHRIDNKYISLSVVEFSLLRQQFSALFVQLLSINALALGNLIGLLSVVETLGCGHNGKNLTGEDWSSELTGRGLIKESSKLLQEISAIISVFMDKLHALQTGLIQGTFDMKDPMLLDSKNLDILLMIRCRINQVQR